MYCSNDECAALQPCSIHPCPVFKCLISDCYEMQPCDTHAFTYEVSSCGTQNSGFNRPSESDVCLHSQSHEHYIQYESRKESYILQGSLFLIDNCEEYFCQQGEVCGFCGEAILITEDFTFNLNCMCSYHKTCMKLLLLKGYTSDCVQCENVDICKPCIRCSY